MSVYGLAIYNADGSLYFTSGSGQQIAIIADTITVAAGQSTTVSYPQLANMPVNVQTGAASTAGSDYDASVSYPNGVPTVTIPAGGSARSYMVFLNQ